MSRHTSISAFNGTYSEFPIFDHHGRLDLDIPESVANSRVAMSRVSCAAVTVSLCLCTGLRGELYRGACCDNNEQDHETRTAVPISSYPIMHRVRFPVRHTEPPTRRRPPPLHAYLCSLPPGGTHPAHARAGRRHRARRGNGQTSSAARPPHVPSFTITPARVARAHRASDPRVRSTL